MCSVEQIFKWNLAGPANVFPPADLSPPSLTDPPPTGKPLHCSSWGTQQRSCCSPSVLGSPHLRILCTRSGQGILAPWSDTFRSGTSCYSHTASCRTQNMKRGWHLFRTFQQWKRSGNLSQYIESQHQYKYMTVYTYSYNAKMGEAVQG